MPSSPVLAHTGIGVIGALAAIALVASLLTLIASALLLWRYRRAVARLMAVSADAAIRSAEQAGVASPPERNALAFATDSRARIETSPEQLYRRTVDGPSRQALRYAIAGALYALTVACAAYFAFAQIQVNFLRAAAHPLQFLFLFWSLAWPVVLTIDLAGAFSRPIRWLNVCVYFIVLATLGCLLAFTPTETSIVLGDVVLPAWSGESPLRLLGKWALFNLAPTLLHAAFRLRRVRAVAPLVLAFMALVSAGVLGVLITAFVYQETSVAIVVAIAESLGIGVHAALLGYLALAALVACAAFAALGWGALAWLQRSYRRKSSSDQSAAVDALWLTFATFHAVALAAAGSAWALFPVAAFVVLKAAFRAASRLVPASGAPLGHDPALLVLRVFSLGPRSEAVFDATTRRWRHVGAVSLIAGTDLAASTVAPHRFLAFVSRRLASLFIADEVAARDAVATIDRRRDADGRYRVNELFCHADTWQAVLRRLIVRTDAVLMDLRSFSPGNAGCVFEIEALLAAVPAERLVFVVDRTTDRRFLDRTWQEACGQLPADSPNHRPVPPALMTYELPAMTDQSLRGLLQRLCAAACAGTGAPAPSPHTVLPGARATSTAPGE
ncbi:MAG: hypothetical protein ACREUX_05875 [Burkholderiales bacterium]